jgi:hypothetical protein
MTLFSDMNGRMEQREFHSTAYIPEYEPLRSTARVGLIDVSQLE